MTWKSALRDDAPSWRPPAVLGDLPMFEDITVPARRNGMRPLVRVPSRPPSEACATRSNTQADYGACFSGIRWLLQTGGWPAARPKALRAAFPDPIRFYARVRKNPRRRRAERRSIGESGWSPNG